MENWKPVPEWSDLYEVSDLGRVRSLDRLVRGNAGSSYRKPGRILRPAVDSHGYPQVQLCRDGKCRSYGLHRLVLLAFVGPRPDGLEIRHLNGVRSDCRLANIEYATRVINVSDKRTHGTQHQLAVTHCPAGHEYSPENTYRHRNKRHCRACKRARSLASYHRRKQH
ncbi:HNH endonuclease [Rhodococcus rhodochrous J45]|uniref:HNH endonuclease n=1 Tax=Rhodococcus rhodochrous J45 TaxID=935266 RepID=A0A562D5W0_RHORH|nr:NUMOD4 motif-containing HNH endonuclease [Rhodococcus rhodochrous]TWH05093.1 HNH endonuclease [Rhodococcus rhodochrous J45]